MKTAIILSVVTIAAFGHELRSVKRPASCADVKKYDSVSGIHTLFLSDNKQIKVYCDQTTDNGGWAVFQRRQDGSVDFYRDWKQYEAGFGDLSGEFWIGLENLYHLIKPQNVTLRIDLTDYDGSTAYAIYKEVSISDTHDNYRLYLGEFNGTAGDGLSWNNKMQFSTHDADHDTVGGYDCAQELEGAWWYAYCSLANLNGRYKKTGLMSHIDGVYWFSWKSDLRSLKRVEMKIKK